MTFLINNVALLALLAASTPTSERLRAALLDPDPDAVVHVGAGLPPEALERALRNRDRLVRQAAVRAAPACEDAWVLLLPLARLASEADRPLAAEAARAAARIGRDLDRDQVVSRDISGDELRDPLRAWRHVGADPSRWPDVRVQALEVGASLASALGPDALATDVSYDRSARLADDEPEVRRAAVELLPSARAGLPVASVVERLVADESDTVALVSAQVLCAGLWLGDPPEPLLEAIGEKGLERVRRLIGAPHMPPAAILDAARCLADDGAPESVAALARVAARGPRSIRRRIRRLIRKGR